MNTTYEKYDFRSPHGVVGEISNQLTEWFKQFRSVLKERWILVSGKEVELTFQSDQTVSFANLKSEIDTPSLAFQVDFGPESVPSMMFADRSELLKLVSGVLADVEPEEEENKDRPLTSIENDLAEMLFHEIVTSLAESWPHQEPVALRLGKRESLPHRSRLFSPKQLMLKFEFLLQQGAASVVLVWTVPQQDFENVFDLGPGTSRPELKNSLARIEEKIKVAHVHLSVLLGHSEVRLSDLTNISRGDVILLDQKVTDPLSVRIQDEPKFLAWPGKNGNMQSIKIAEMVETQ